MLPSKEITRPASGRLSVPLVAALVVGLMAAACSSNGGPSSGTNSTTIEGPRGSTSGSEPPHSTDSASSTASTAATTSSAPTSSAPTTTDPDSPVAVPTFVDENGFDDHTVPNVDSIAELMALSRQGVGGQWAMKFTLPEFDRAPDAPNLARAHLMDGNFYGLHDEWYYFRLLNGQPVPGVDLAPITGRRFDTVEDIYQWAALTPAASLPLGLSFIGERLYASAFYDLALHGDPRTYGVGSIVRFADPVAGQPDHWLIELEYSDIVTPALVARFFERLDLVLPDEVSSRLEWVVRSPQHEGVAQQMAQQQLPYHDRIVRFRELVPEGTVAVYSEGVTAGRLLYVGEGGAQLTDATETDLIVTERVPDWLPPASALITSDPQTPLAHVNLLARNRAIPNASQAGIHDDAGVRQAARVRAYAIVIARGATLQIALISREQYAAWTARQQPQVVAVPPVDISTMPLVVNLGLLASQLAEGGLTQGEIANWIPVIGGKSGGFITLLSTPGLTPPPDPLAITVRPYLEHIAPIRDVIAAAISDPELVASPLARWITLEGSDDLADLFPSAADAEFAAAFLARHPPGSPLGDVLAAGGVRAVIEARPIEPNTLAEITNELNRSFGDYNVAAGLRFRSSSSVEDIEGFNGAGLYTSYTGFLHTDLLEDPDDRNNTIERAMLRAWSSYWSFEAFEERRLGRIDHLSGAMGMTVHARFDDELERNNGVATFTFLPGFGLPGFGLPGSGADDATVEINVQAGSVEVTNPDPDDIELPEVIRVTRRNGGLSIERVRGSTLLAQGQQVMDDVAIRQLFEQTAAVAQVWRNRVNESLSAAQQLQTVVLDFEFKTMEAGWPKLADGAQPYPARLVLRQVRSLDPGLRRLSASTRTLPVPRDVLMRAALVETVRCTSPTGGAPIEHIEVRTDPYLVPDMGYADQPLIVGVAPPAGASCTRMIQYASRGQELLALVANGDAFVIVG